MRRRPRFEQRSRAVVGFSSCQRTAIGDADGLASSNPDGDALGISGAQLIIEPNCYRCLSASRDDRREFTVRRTERKERLYEQVEGHRRVARFHLGNA